MASTPTRSPVNAVLGASWSASLTIGHLHGAMGPLSLKIRSSTVNGPNFFSPLGGRLTEVLVGSSASPSGSRAKRIASRNRHQ